MAQSSDQRRAEGARDARSGLSDNGRSAWDSAYGAGYNSSIDTIYKQNYTAGMQAGKALDQFFTNKPTGSVSDTYSAVKPNCVLGDWALALGIIGFFIPFIAILAVPCSLIGLVHVVFAKGRVSAIGPITGLVLIGIRIGLQALF